MKDILKKLLNVPALRRSVSVVGLISIDIAALLVSFFGAEYLVGGGDRVGEILTLVPLLVVGWVVIFAAHDLYDKAQTRRDPGALIGAVLSWAGLVVLGSVIYPESALALGEVLLGRLLRPDPGRRFQALLRTGDREDLPSGPRPDDRDHNGQY